jgi:signal transduction histidine kinase
MAQNGVEKSFDRSVLAALLELSCICCIDRSDWPCAIQQILRVDARVLDVERVSYWRAQEEPRAIVCEMAYQRGTEAFERGHVLPAAEHLAYFEAIEAGPVCASDAVHDVRTSSMADYLATRAIGAMLDFPVRVRGRFAGILCHEHVGEARAWCDEDQQFAASVAQVIASSLTAQERAEAERAACRAAFLDRATRLLGETLDPAEVTNRALALVVPCLADGSTIDVHDGVKLRRVGFTAATAAGQAGLAELTRLAGVIPPQASERTFYLPEYVVARRDSILIPTVSDGTLAKFGIDDTEVARVVRAMGARSAMAVPLYSGPRVIGAMSFVSFARQFETDDLHLAEQFAPRLACALENARLHQRAVAAVRARDEFIALAAHELHTPVTALQLAADALVRRTNTASVNDIARTAERMATQVRRLARLIRQMLDASHVGARQMLLALERTDLREVVGALAEILGPRCDQAGCKLTIVADAPVVGEWDRTRIEQMLFSLLDNALKFGAGKPIEVSTTSDGTTATLSVRDHGPGIPPDRLDSVFDAFERAVPMENYGGLGLGLYVARAIARAHGGDLTAVSGNGEGTTFTARLPTRPCSNGAGE